MNTPLKGIENALIDFVATGLKAVKPLQKLLNHGIGTSPHNTFA